MSVESENQGREILIVKCGVCDQSFEIRGKRFPIHSPLRGAQHMGGRGRRIGGRSICRGSSTFVGNDEEYD